MTKQHPLRVQPLGNGAEFGYYSKGHHDQQAFCNAAMSVLMSSDDEELIKPERVQYTLWRWVPQPRGSEFDYVAQECSAPARGVFPVTFVDVIY